MSKGTQIAEVQQAVDLQQAAKEIDALAARVKKGDQIVNDWRYQMGLILAQVRKTFPESGPRAKGWGEFVEARGISQKTALRYMEIVEEVRAKPDLILGGHTLGDLYKMHGTNTPPPQDRSRTVQSEISAPVVPEERRLPQKTYEPALPGPAGEALAGKPVRRAEPVQEEAPKQPEAAPEPLPRLSTGPKTERGVKLNDLLQLSAVRNQWTAAIDEMIEECVPEHRPHLKKLLTEKAEELT
jgi:hypothetical protein